MRVNEVFGPTVQGEGPSAGRPAVFVRLAGCNLDCGAGPGAAWACDTPYSWDWTGKLGQAFDPTQESHRRDHEDVAAQVAGLSAHPLVVVTGGEPMLQRTQVAQMVLALHRYHKGREWRVEVETNGTIDPGPVAGLAVFNVSPKLASSGVPREQAWKPDVLRLLAAAPSTSFKFVVARWADLDEVQDFMALVGVDPERVWVMPAGTDAARLTETLEELGDRAVELGVNVTTRLHVHMWGDRRGV